MTNASWIAVSCIAGAGCSFDLSSYEPSGASAGAAHPSATTSGMPSGTTTSVTSGAVTSGTGTNTTTGTASSSSTGAGTPIASCGGFTDDFSNFPNNPMWNVSGATQQGGHAQAKFVAVFAGAWRNPTSYGECYASIELLDLSGGTAYLNLWRDNLTSIAIGYDGSKVIAPQMSVTVADPPKALAIAFFNNHVYYLFMKQGGSAWEAPFDIEARASWMDGATNVLGFGISSANYNDTATFADFNTLPVASSDL
jgi:hypothetical protein